MFDEAESPEQFRGSSSGTTESEAACLHRQRLLDIGLPAVIDKNAAGEETVYIVLPIEGNLYKLRWRGWHAFRRGLATNLHRLGVDDKTIQTILRHGSVQTTREIYIKGVSSDATAAMERLEVAIQNQSAKPN
jgi:hypothetical protein